MPNDMVNLPLPIFKKKKKLTPGCDMNMKTYEYEYVCKT